MGDANAPVPGSSAVIAVVGTALAGLPPAPPNAGSRGVEYREDVESREAREPGRSGEDCGRPGAVVAGKDAVGKGDGAGGCGDGVRAGESCSGDGKWGVGLSSGCSGATGAWAKSREREDGPATGVVEFDPKRAAGKCRELGARAG